MRSLQRFPTRGGQIHCPLPAIALSPLVATLTDPLASVANKRLMIRLSPLDATLTRNRGSGLPHSGTRHSSLATAVKFFAFTLLRTLLHFSALAQNSTRFFPIASALFVQKHGGVGYALHPYFVTSLLHYRQKRQRPSRSDGGSCEKGAPSSGEKIVSSVKSVVGRRRRRRVWPPERVNEHFVFAGGYRVVRGHREQRCRRFRPLNVCQRVRRIAKPGIRMSALDVHLQVCRIPVLRHDGDRFLVPDLSRRNRSRGPRPFRSHSLDRLWSERLGLGSSFRRSLEVAIEHIAARPASRPDFHPPGTRHLPRNLLVGFQYIRCPGYWIADVYERVRLPGSRQRTNRRQRYVFAKPPLAVPIHIRSRRPRDVIAVRQRLRRLRGRNRAERRSLHHFSAMQPATEAEQLNSIRKESVAPGHHSPLDALRAWSWSRLCFLRSRRSRTYKKSDAQYRVQPSHFMLHFSFSSSLPNCCELFAAAIAASPFFNCAIHASIGPPCSFRSSPCAGFNFSPKAAAPMCVSSLRRSKCASPTVNIYCASRTASGNPSPPTSRSTWIHSLARSSFTGSPSAPSAPRCMRTRRIAASSVSTKKAPGRNVKPLNSLSATSVSELPAPAETGRGIPFGTTARIWRFPPAAELSS